MKFKLFNNIKKEEIKNVKKVLRSGCLSDFLGSKDETKKNRFLGGKYVRKLENDYKKFYNVKHAISVNSWTSGLEIAVGALDLEPGDEIIVPTWTMCASASAILRWNVIPIFADIDKKTFCIDPSTIEKLITNRTRAIIVVDIFGLSSDVDKIKKIANKHNLKIISDNAQAPYSFYKKKLAGTHFDIGGFSLNTHKHIQTGEGGVLVTNNKYLAKKMQMLRNHGEAVVSKKNKKMLINMIGGNYRMTELTAAIAIAQLKKLKKIVNKIQSNSKIFSEKLSKLRGLDVPYIPSDQTHSYYMYAIKINEKITKVRKDKIFRELRKHNFDFIENGYILVHTLPMYEKKIAYGKKGFPWNLNKRKINYKKNICKNANYLQKNSIILIQMTKYDFSRADVNYICGVFLKIWKKLKIQE